ncbi:fatty-acyl-CoA synthase [Halopseudomonas sabulinigri]|uniref:Fatty-acyl-CoA synthase n=1 Tax=Halopseudomonas sabulinigri TaxID=472181 RepID=A0A1H1VPU1_9GAMM|nr:acyl-CoA synthetase [Halopseudomonas sabulinigri]SDS86441.1 fatty-acyl-CoA synthase [Halopseudomonas sabulinigri]
MATRCLADIHTIEQVPLASRNLPASTYAALRAAADRHPAALALRFVPDVRDLQASHAWSYSELLAEITRVANTLNAIALGKDDVVAFLLPNLPETHFVIWGGEAAGVVMAVNPLLEAEQIAKLLRAANARVVVTLAPTPGTDLWEKISSIADDLPSVSHYFWVSMAPYVAPAQREALQQLGEQRRAEHAALDIRWLHHSMQAQAADALDSGRDIQGSDLSSLFCTGGTTGLPKIARRTHASEVFNAWAMSENLQPQAQGQVYFCGLPLFHVNGQLVTGLMPWMRGDSVLIGSAKGYRGDGVLENFWALVERYRVSFFSGVPTVYSSLLQYPVGGRDIGSLKYALCGAAPMPVALFNTFEQVTGVRILEGYGLTEGACVSSSNPADGERRVGSIGLRLAYQHMRAVVLDDEGGYLRDAPTNEAGLLVIRGPNVFAGYIEAAHNQSVWIEIDGEQWLNTGDLGRQDADGYFWLTGRKKELIIRGGHNIDPGQIESVLQSHPDVGLCAAVGSPDAHAGEVPVAYVQLRVGAVVSEAQLQAFASEHISERAAVPKRIHVVEALPTTAVGKLFKPALQQQEIRNTLQAEVERAGLRNLGFDVVQDASRGLLARIDGQVSAAFREAIERYAFKVEWID